MASVNSLDGACRLIDRGLIRARGPDAAKFLQGQLSNDVLTLSATQARLAAFCSAKGRMQASFVVWREAADGFLLACASSLLAPTLKRLTLFVLRAQCKLSDAGGEVELWGAVGPAATATLADMAVWEKREHAGTTCVRLPDAAGLRRCLLAVPAGAAQAPVWPSLPLADWRWLEVQSGIATIEAATVDRFVPQMVNFELVGGVDFQKGCYPGQEVVARSQYRGTTKRRSLLFDCDALPAPGDDVFLAGPSVAGSADVEAGTGAGVGVGVGVGAVAGEPVGTVVNAASHPARPGASALVEVRLAALDGDELRLGSPNGPRLRPVQMPYPVTPDAEAAG